VLATDEFEGGLVAAAAPVRDGGGAIVGALNVSAPSFRVEGQEEDLCAAVVAAAADLGRALAAVNDAPQVDAA
jgi:IclR family KDG regulon transcriptional repressor